MARRLFLVMDYENVLRTGHSAVSEGRHLSQCTIDPFKYACQVARVLNRGKIKDDPDYVVVSRIEVYRGWPDARANPRGHALNEMQKTAWMTGHHGVVDVTLRPLQRRRDGDGWNEKGVDVLCALALVRGARSQLYEDVVLASRDSDLAPAVEEAIRGKAKGVRVGTVTWHDPEIPSTLGCLKTIPTVDPIQLWRAEYDASLDINVYENRKQRRARKRREAASS